MQVMHRLIQALQQFQALRGDARFDDSAVVLLALAYYPAVFFHAVQQPGHVGIPGNHAFRNATAEQAVGFGAAKNAQDVVLGGGQSGGFKELLSVLGKRISGPEDGDEELIFEGSGRFARKRHKENLVVITTIVKRKDAAPHANCPADSL